MQFINKVPLTAILRTTSMTSTNSVGQVELPAGTKSTSASIQSDGLTLYWSIKGDTYQRRFDTKTISAFFKEVSD